MKAAVSTPNAPSAIGPYSQAIRTGTLLFVSGQIPVNPETGTMAEGIENQTTQVLTNIRSILESAGLSMKNVVKSTVFMTDLSDFSRMNAVYETFFPAPFPARSCVQVAQLPKNAALEIEVIAEA